MYHIKDDKRMLQSADCLIEALTRCLKTKPLTAISYTDLSRESGVGRSTIYRLFDTTIDIVAYGCDRFAQNVIREYRKRTVSAGLTREQFALFSLQMWMEASDLLELVVNCKRTDLLLNSIKKYEHEVPQVKISDDASEAEKEYIRSIVRVSYTTIIFTWMNRGKKESPEDVYKIFRRMILNLANAPQTIEVAPPANE